MDSPHLTIRPARPSDVPALAVLSAQLGYPAPPERVARRLEAVQAQPGHVVLVAEADGRVAGWIHLFVIRSLLSEGGVEVEGLVVDEQRRGQGVGRALIAQAEGWARAQGCDFLYLRSNTLRARAHEFYEQLGFEKLKTQFAFRKRLS